ncbi:MAG: hypothetical protein AB7H86_00545 [Blastocatellales bacterium]
MLIGLALISVKLIAAVAAGGQSMIAEQWTELGPNSSGGRTRELIFHPTDPMTIYAAASSGGVWKTIDGGNNWVPLTDKLPSLAFNSLAIDRNAPDILYAGTGEGFINIDARRGTGIFKSIDGGASWTLLEATLTSDFHYVNDIVISPNNSGRIYAATQTGVWRSLDGGGLWTQVHSYPDYGGCQDLAIRTDKQTDFIFASCGKQSGGIFRNTAGEGASQWEPVFRDEPLGRTTLAIAPSNQNIIYALSAYSGSGGEKPDSHLLGVFRSVKSGDVETWELRTVPVIPSRPNGTLGGSILSDSLTAFSTECGRGISRLNNIGWYAGAFAVDPVNPDRIWAGGVDLFRSDDGGANWGLASYSRADRDKPQFVPANQHAIAFPPDYDGMTRREMLVSNDGGIWKTDDSLATTAQGSTAPCDPSNGSIHWRSLNNDYNVTLFNSGAVNEDGSIYFGGTQGEGLLKGSDAAGPDGWERLLPGIIGSIAVEPAESRIVYASVFNDYDPVPAYPFKSSDGGARFIAAGTGLPKVSYAFQHYWPILLDPSDSRRIWAGLFGIIRSENAAASWINVSPQTGFAAPSAIAAARTNSNRVLVGTTSGSILRTSDGISTDQPSWFSATPRSGYISGLVFDPNDEQIAYATYSTFGGSHLWKSINGGAAWQSIDGTGNDRLPDIPVNCIAVDPNHPQRIFAGTDSGLFVSQVGGGSWSVAEGLPRAPVVALVFHYSNGSMFLTVFTHGRGAWRIKTSEQACRFWLSKPELNAAGVGALEMIDIVAEGGACAWTTRSNDPWITVTGGVSGSGKAEIVISENRSTSRRTGTVTIAGRSLTIRQDTLIDTTPPSIQITSPTSDPVIELDEDFIILKGTSSDDLGLASLSMSVDNIDSESRLGGIGPFGNWSSGPTTIRYGVTKITVTATDASGNSSSDVLTVIRRPAYYPVPIAGKTAPPYQSDGGQALLTQITTPKRLAFDAAGNLYVAHQHRIRKITPGGIITTVAGGSQPGFSGDGGPAIAARLNDPSDIVFDGRGNLLIADSANNRIRQIDTNGIIRTIAGKGPGGFSGDGGPAIDAELSFPIGLAFDTTGNLFIADFSNNRIRKIALDGTISTIAGNGGSSVGGDGGPATDAGVLYPADMVFDAQGNMLIAQLAISRIRRVGTDGIITTIAGGSGSGIGGDGGPAFSARLSSPASLLIEDDGSILIADYGNNRIRRITPDGIIRTVARLISPYGLAKTASGDLFAAQINTNQISRLMVVPDSDSTVPTITIINPVTSGASYSTQNSSIGINVIATDNHFITHVTWANDRGGSGTAGGFAPQWTALVPSLKPGLNAITITAWDVHGNSATAGIVINYVSPYSLVNFAGIRKQAGFMDGDRPASKFMLPSIVATDRNGNLYVSDSGNHRIRKITPAGIVRTIAGNGEIGTNGAGGPAVEAELNDPRGLCIDAGGSVYFTDAGNHRIYRITAGGILEIIAGTGFSGFGVDGAQALESNLNAPTGLAIDSAGNIYFSDSGTHRVRKIDAQSGVVTTVAGNGIPGSTFDQTPGEIRLNTPEGLTFDGSGNLYIADSETGFIRRATPDGTITNFAGSASGSGVDGDPATRFRLNRPVSISFDPEGNFYIIEERGSSIRKVLPDGRLYSIQPTDGDSLPLNDQINPIRGLRSMAISESGRIFLADLLNHRIVEMKITNFPLVATVSAASFLGETLAPGSIVAGFGPDLSSSIEVASSLPLPVSLGGSTVVIRDYLQAERQAPLFFVSPNQINFFVPYETYPGNATIIITNERGEIAAGTSRIDYVAPAIFAANANGLGVAAALVLRVRLDGSQVYEPVSAYDSSLNRFVPLPIDMGPPTDQLILILFGTGIRGRPSLQTVQARIAGLDTEVLYAGDQGGFIGLDQVNLRLPRNLSGIGEAVVELTVAGKSANSVSVTIK